MAPIAQFSGLASGIDSASLIDALVKAKLKTNDLRKNQITDLESENDALEELNTKLLKLSELVDKFRSSNGGGVSKKATSSNATVASAAVSAAASNSSIGVTVTSVASTATGSFDDVFTSGDALFAANAVGSQAIGVQIGTGANQVDITVDVTSSTTAQQYVDAFNADSDATGRALASLVKVGTNDYRVVITTLKSGVEDGSIGFTVPGAVNFGGFSDLQARTTDQATDAEFSIDGIGGAPITRSSNSISDVLTGVTFQLSSNGTANIAITDDSDSTADQFQEIVEAFNDIVEYVSDNSTSTQDTTSSDRNIIYGSLGKTRIDNDFISQFRETLLGAASGGTGAVQTFADLGISTNRDGTIAFDVEKFKSAVSGDSAGATALFQDFADSTAGVGGFIFQYTTFQGFIDSAQSSNLTQIDNLNDSISQLERSADKLRERYTLTFARLESITANLQRQQSELSSILGGLS